MKNKISVESIKNGALFMNEIIDKEMTLDESDRIDWVDFYPTIMKAGENMPKDEGKTFDQQYTIIDGITVNRNVFNGGKNE